MKNLLLFLLACCLCAAASARPIRGSVKCGGKPMGGVTVTDGYTFAQSDEQGIFTLDADDQALFISLVTPSGYMAPLEGGIPQFYRTYDPAAKRYDFELQPWPGSGECYELLAIADPQPKTEEHFRRLRSEVMPALQAATDNGRTRGANQAAIVLGDIVWDSPELFAGVKAEFAKLGVPVYGVIGNHDHDLNKYTDREATENYRSHFGPTYYAFDMGRTHYIVLDDIVYHGAKKYEERIDTMQLRWAAAYAERLPAGSRVCIAMHAPAMKSWLGNRVMESAEGLMDAFAGHELHFITGHTHLNSNYDIRGGGHGTQRSAGLRQPLVGSDQLGRYAQGLPAVPRMRRGILVGIPEPRRVPGTADPRMAPRPGGQAPGQRRGKGMELGFVLDGRMV